MINLFCLNLVNRLGHHPRTGAENLHANVRVVVSARERQTFLHHDRPLVDPFRHQMHGVAHLLIQINGQFHTGTSTVFRQHARWQLSTPIRGAARVSLARRGVLAITNRSNSNRYTSLAVNLELRS
jgi:hypothetical protein